jgi:type VI secretion system protein ImpG
LFNTYYQQELQNLRGLAKEFSKAHPAVAPLLSGPSSDPDVERLLQGVAFLSGLLHNRLDDDFPEIIHGLTDIIFPHYLRPIPSTSIVIFTPKSSLKEKIFIKAGTSLSSIPVEGTKCSFRTCFNLEVHPVQLLSAESIQLSNNINQIRLVLELKGLKLSQWNPESINFFLAENHSQAATLYMLLTKHLKRIILKPADGGTQAILSPRDIIPTGLKYKNSLLPYPTNSFKGYRVLQEYFILPQKFLFLELTGWEKWKNRGEGNRFEIIFELGSLPISLTKVKNENFRLFATPVINLFSDDSVQILLEHRSEKLRVRPSNKNKDHYQVYSVDNIVGYEQGNVKPKKYVPFEFFSDSEEKKHVYQVIRSKSPIDNTTETYLSFTYPSNLVDIKPETLSLNLTFTNGKLPENLRVGDICEQTSDSSGLLDFQNIISPTSPVEPLLGKNMLWRLLSHLSTNFLSIGNVDSLKELLKLYILQHEGNRTNVAANTKRIEGIIDLKFKSIDRIIDRMMMRGQKIEMTVRQDYFDGVGDLYLFGSIIDSFFSVYCSMNTFTQFEMIDSFSGERFQWPERLGDRYLT